MTVKTKTIKGTTEIFETDGYIISSIRDMHPDILKVHVYSNGKLIAKKKRKFIFLYKKFFYKPLNNT